MLVRATTESRRRARGARAGRRAGGAPAARSRSRTTRDAARADGGLARRGPAGATAAPRAATRDAIARRARRAAFATCAEDRNLPGSVGGRAGRARRWRGDRTFEGPCMTPRFLRPEPPGAGHETTGQFEQPVVIPTSVRERNRERRVKTSRRAFPAFSVPLEIRIRENHQAAHRFVPRVFFFFLATALEDPTAVRSVTH